MGDVMRNGYVQGEGLGPQKTNWNGERAPTAEEIARDGVTEPRTAAIGSTPEGAKNPLWSAEEFNGTWFFCCIPLACAKIKQTNIGEDVVKMQIACCLILPLTKEYARTGNTNRFESTGYYDDSDTNNAGHHREWTEKDPEAFTYTSKTTFTTNGVPAGLALGWKTSRPT